MQNKPKSELALFQVQIIELSLLWQILLRAEILPRNMSCSSFKIESLNRCFRFCLTHLKSVSLSPMAYF